MIYIGTRLYRSIELADYRDASGRSVGVAAMDCLIGNHGRLHIPLEKAWDVGGLLGMLVRGRYLTVDLPLRWFAGRIGRNVWKCQLYM